MDASCSKYCIDLQQELENAKGTLIVLNESIKRIAGRPARRTRDSRFERKCSHEDRRSKFENSKRPEQHSELFSNKGVFVSKPELNTLSAPLSRCIELDPRPKLTSRVIREMPSRQEVVAVQCSDSASKARNRRMFGSLLGTLQKFCQEESRLKIKEENKVRIEKKIEEQKVLERESLKKERDALFHDRKLKQIKIKCLEEKVFRIKDFEMWENSTNCLKPFIKTKTKPSIYYKPKNNSDKTHKLLHNCQKAVVKFIFNRKEKLHNDLMEMEEHFKHADFELDEHTNSPVGRRLLNVGYSSLNENVLMEMEDDKNFEDIKIQKTIEQPLITNKIP